MSDVFHYRPKQARARVPLEISVACLFFGGLAIVGLPHAISVFFGSLAATLLFCLPYAAAGVGFSYVLHSDELVICRFDRERYRVALAEYRGRRLVLGYPRLRFASRSVSIVSGEDADRAAFLHELDLRVAAFATGTPIRIARMEDDRVTLRLDELSFPDACACCGKTASTDITLIAERSFDFVSFLQPRSFEVLVPLCGPDVARHRNVRWAAYAIVFATFAVPCALWIGLRMTRFEMWIPILAGSIVGGGAMWLARAFGLTRAASYRAIGIATVELDSELQHVTLRVRDAELRAHLADAGSADIVASVFA